MSSGSPLARRLAGLDGLRGVAILAVILYHYTLVGAGDTLLDKVVGSAMSYGAYGVTLFFVLSGFLITGILLDAKGSNGYFRTFYARRVLRIFPLYYAVLVALLVIVPSIGFLREVLSTGM